MLLVGEMHGTAQVPEVVGRMACHAALRSQGEDRGSEPFVERLDARDDEGFDGVLSVGATSASEPAVPTPAAEPAR